MIPIITGLLFSLCFIFAYLLFNPPKKKRDQTKKRKSLLSRLNLDKYEDKAEAIGWKVSTKELGIIIGIAIIFAIGISLLTQNIFVLVAGVAIGIYVPSILIEQKRKAIRYNLISKLPDPLRMLLSRIPDQQNLTKAIETTCDEVSDDYIKALLSGYIKDVAVGNSVQDALLKMKKKVKLRKFDTFVENLNQAHYEGFTSEALSALDKSIEAIEFDLRAIEKVREISKKKKQQLYMSVGISWLFLPILSMVSTGNRNVYLYTLPGKILVLYFVLGSAYIFLKGEEFLSLNLDDL